MNTTECSVCRTSRITATRGESKMLVFQGTLIHATVDNPLVVMHRKLIGVDGAKIVFVEDVWELEDLKDKYGFEDSDVQVLGAREFLMPGFVDAHVHPFQYACVGMSLERTLMDWLAIHIRPLINHFTANEHFADEVHRKAVRRLLKNGTTTASYFPTEHLGETVHLCDIVEEYGQRAVIGRLALMWDIFGGPVESLDVSLENTELMIKNILARKTGLITPAVMPATAFVNDEPALRRMAEMSTKYGIPLQSHLAENADAVEMTKEKNPQFSSDTDMYDKCGLLTERSIMAHAVHLTEDEVQLIKDKQVGVVHCPNSNISLKNGLCDIRRMLDKGLKIALGTGMAAGYSPSMLDAMRYAVQTSNILQMLNKNGYVPLTFREVFRLATLGGSRVLGLDHKIGNFVVGKEFDALRVNVAAPGSPFDVFNRDKFEDMVQKFFYLGDDRNIVAIYVAGKDVTPDH